MRAAAIAFVVTAIASAHAAPMMRDVVVQPPRAPTGPAPTAFANVSHVIYLDNCLPDGCAVLPGYDDALTQHSSIPQQPATLAPWRWGQDNWNTLVQCVRDMYAPFDIQITDQDPGTTPHFELIVGGSSSDVGIAGAGGVAPFVPCNGELQDNVISFVFAAETGDLDYLCWAAAQETAHVLGLDHEMSALDPMTYLPPDKKEGFQNEDANCGEYQPRTCWCGGTTQNSYQYLMDTIGPNHLDPARLAITTPSDGAWVLPGFVVRVQLTSQVSARTGTLQIDGAIAQSIAEPPVVFDAPVSLAAGDHAIVVTVTDAAGRTETATATVHAVAACAAGERCASGFDCLGGFCLPGADMPGGLGAPCTDNTACATGTCASDGTTMLCAAACDDGACPHGFSCTSAGVASVCWPSKGGGCAASSSQAWLIVVLALGALARRRKR